MPNSIDKAEIRKEYEAIPGKPRIVDYLNAPYCGSGLFFCPHWPALILQNGSSL